MEDNLERDSDLLIKKMKTLKAVIYQKSKVTLLILLICLELKQ